MRVFYGTYDAQGKLKNTVVTVGSFDGVHSGHKLIIDRLKKTASNIAGETLIVTFHPHPRIVLFPAEKDLMLIYSLDEKIELLSRTGLDNLVIIPFSIQFSQTTSYDFVSKILFAQLGAKVVVVGQNHQFGHNRSGDLDYLSKLSHELGFRVENIPTKVLENETVSSTKVRKALLEGNITLANAYLSHEYIISGLLNRTVLIAGNKNLESYNPVITEVRKLVPPTGIYATKMVVSDSTYMSITIVNEVINGARTVQTIPIQNNINHNGERGIIYFFKRIYGEEAFEANVPKNENIFSALRIAEDLKL